MLVLSWMFSKEEEEGNWGGRKVAPRLLQGNAGKGNRQGTLCRGGFRHPPHPPNSSLAPAADSPPGRAGVAGVAPGCLIVPGTQLRRAMSTVGILKEVPGLGGGPPTPGRDC